MITLCILLFGKCLRGGFRSRSGSGSLRYSEVLGGSRSYSEVRIKNNRNLTDSCVPQVIVSFSTFLYGTRYARCFAYLTRYLFLCIISLVKGGKTF